MTDLSASLKLKNSVIDNSFCTSCGACVGLCPYFATYRGKVILMDNCDLTQGRCFSFCPRTPADLNDINKAVFGVPYSWEPLGNVLRVLQGRSTEAPIRKRAQYGGVVTALNSFALEKGVIDSVVLTSSKDKLHTKAVIATTRKEVLDCSGSSYIAVPILEVFNRAVAAGNNSRIGVTGTPCQILALAKMKIATPDNKTSINKLKLTIGLFCTWALSYDSFSEFLATRVKNTTITRVDIPPPPASSFEVKTTSQAISIPLNEIRQYIKTSCSYCIDMTAEFADISVGTVEGVNDWNTILIRSQMGLELVEKAVAEKVIEIQELPKRNFNHLKDASILKKKRALKNIIDRTGNEKDLYYLNNNYKKLIKLIEA
ncbi:MAG: Coenzyme F420 hydrogenase/dehydrogenase, beta subunit C-terminal domain [Dehalococcoidales bacterium]|nr:Coenzyme F420 hydrogenase/dehydrogenase, beta subunit C-terminal domain [Dehalococcoidales bacterium]